MTLYNTNIDLVNVMCLQNLILFRLFVLKILSKTPILTSIKGHYSVANLPKKCFTILSMIICIQNLVLFRVFILKILSKNLILASIKGRNPVTNLQKLMRDNPNLGIVHVNVCTKFCLILSIRSQDIQKKQNRNNGMNEGQGESRIAPLFQSAAITRSCWPSINCGSTLSALKKI